MFLFHVGPSHLRLQLPHVIQGPAQRLPAPLIIPPSTATTKLTSFKQVSTITQRETCHVPLRMCLAILLPGFLYHGGHLVPFHRGGAGKWGLNPSPWAGGGYQEKGLLFLLACLPCLPTSASQLRSSLQWSHTLPIRKIPPLLHVEVVLSPPLNRNSTS